MKALCERCGSIRMVRAQPGLTDRVVRLFTAKRPFVCRRCGWRGRRSWSDPDLEKLLDYGAGGAEPDPDLAALDVDPSRRPNKKEVSRDGSPAAFDLAAIDLAQPVATLTEPIASIGERRITRKRRRRSRRREVIATLAITAAVIALAAMLALSVS